MRFSQRFFVLFCLRLIVVGGLLWVSTTAGGRVAQAQTFRFILRAEPDAIAANGVSSTSILVQSRQVERSGISAQPIVRFATTAGTIEPQARLSNGVARVLLRSANTPGTAIVTAFIGNSREQISVEFTEGTPEITRYWEVKGSPVSYGAERNIITAAGPCSLDLGNTHIESDVRLDIDVVNQWVWAQGNSNRVLIRNRDGARIYEMRGERLFFDLRRKRGVIRRLDTSQGPARQEFMGSNLLPVSGSESANQISPPVAPTTSTPAVKEAPEEQVQPVGFVPVARPSIVQIENPPIVAYNEKSADSHSRDGQTPIETGDALSRGAFSRDEASRVAVLPQKLTPSKGGEPAGEDENDPKLTEPPTAVPVYEPLPSSSAKGQLIEPLPPETDYKRGYWVVSRWARLFLDDKLQFGGATVFYNGAKLFFMRLYVAPLDGTFNPATNMIGVNTSAGLSLRVPYYYQASPRGTGAVYLIHAPHSGFAAEKPGFSLGIDHQYWMSKHSQGRLNIDELGRGGWNLDWNHQMEFSPSLKGSLYLNMPRHRDTYLSSGLTKAFKHMDIGLETFYSKPDNGKSKSNLQGSFYARLRPKAIGQSGWTYTVTTNLSATQRYVQSTGSPGGGGIGLPGHNRPGQTQTGRSLWGQSISTVLMAPNYKLWKGASFEGSFAATAFNYSNKERGLSPGVMLGIRQNIGRSASIRLDYQYDRGLVSPLGGSYLGRSTNTLTASADINLGSRIYSNLLISRGLSDKSLYGYSTLDYYFAPKWRTGLFADYSNFDNESFSNYGVSLGRMMGTREVSLNWDQSRGRVYIEFGNFLR